MSSTLLYVVVLLTLRSSLTADDKKCEWVHNRPVQLDKVCHENHTNCYTLFVRKMQFGRNRWIMNLYSIFDGRLDVLGESLIRLIPPTGESIQLHRGYCVDLKTWSIDRNTVVASYIARMLAAPFVMSTLSLDSDNAGKQFLEIGLGGGTLDTALHARKPKVNITAVDIDEIVVKKVAKWFGIRDSRYHHSITKDGVKFVDNAIAEGRKFDVVAIDACDDNHWLPCPAEAFRTEEGLEKIKKVMNDNGTLTVNFLPRIQMNQTVWDEALESYQSVFPTCMMLKARSANVVLVCVPFEVPDTLEFQRLYKQRLTEVISAFELDETLNGFATLEILPNLTF